MLCRCHGESVDHIFLQCSFAAAIWDILLGKFEVHGIPTFPLALLNLGLSYGRSSQLHDLWVACFASTLFNSFGIVEIVLVMMVWKLLFPKLVV